VLGIEYLVYSAWYRVLRYCTSHNWQYLVYSIWHAVLGTQFSVYSTWRCNTPTRCVTSQACPMDSVPYISGLSHAQCPLHLRPVLTLVTTNRPHVRVTRVASWRGDVLVVPHSCLLGDDVQPEAVAVPASSRLLHRGRVQGSTLVGSLTTFRKTQLERSVGDRSCWFLNVLLKIHSINFQHF